jgi:gamma-glutamyltranspeptidase / glutathione hydrolase
MAPTLVSKDGKVFLVLGSPGGSRIITIAAEIITNIVDHGMEPQEAVDAPRIHHQWLPDLVYQERFALSPDTRLELERRGYKVVEQSPWGAAELIEVGMDATARKRTQSSGNDSARSGKVLPGFLYGATDDRRPAGAAIGY